MIHLADSLPLCTTWLIVYHLADILTLIFYLAGSLAITSMYQLIVLHNYAIRPKVPYIELQLKKADRWHVVICNSFLFIARRYRTSSVSGVSVNRYD